jgi:hypothetical protein
MTLIDVMILPLIVLFGSEKYSFEFTSQLLGFRFQQK